MLQNMKYRLILLITLVCTGCERLLISPDEQNTNVYNFELLWKTIHDKYCYFELKHIDWNAIHTKYYARVNDSLSQEAFFTVMSQMMNELKDGHVNLQIPNTRFSYTYYSNQGLLRGYARNFNDSILTNQYLKIGYGQKIRHIVFPQNIGYLYYGSFSSSLKDSEWDTIFQDFVNTKGLIIDVRDNSGGSVENIKTLMKHIVSQKTLIGYTRSKNSEEPNDFKAYTPVYVEPSGTPFYKKVVVLTNRRVFSAANMFVSAMSEQKDVVLVGDITGGGGAGPIGGELLNGWLYRFSAMAFSNSQKQDIENGVSPDIKINISAKDEENNIDSILERAFLEFN